MSQSSVFYPVFAQVFLTLLVMTYMAVKRIGAIRRGEVKMRDIALGEPNWPASVTQVANSFHNQFELPVLFYIACIIAFATKTVTAIFIFLAWGFVAARIGHAYVHLTSNYVPKRAYVYFLGCIVLFMMWLILFVLMLVGGR